MSRRAQVESPVVVVMCVIFHFVVSANSHSGLRTGLCQSWMPSSAYILVIVLIPFILNDEIQTMRVGGAVNTLANRKKDDKVEVNRLH